MTEEFVSGGISGGITDPESIEAQEHAEREYPAIRKRTTDVKHIAENTGYSEDQIRLIKNYLFINEHKLGDEVKRFDACFEIAESWRRLAFAPKDIQSHDLLLIKHELKEIELVSQGVSQSEAHDIVELQYYDYNSAAKNFYKNLREKKEIKLKKCDKSINAGAIIRKKIKDIER